MKHYDFRLMLVALAGVTVLATPAAALVCGDSEPDAGEECDDGNTTPGDGCSATCTVEAGFGCSDAIPGDPVPIPPIPPAPSICGVTPFGNSIFVRGGFNGWGTTDPMSWDPVDDEYTATLTIDPGFWEFKVADDGWSSPDFGPLGDPVVTLGAPTDIGAAIGANFALSLVTAGDYLFTLFDLSMDLQSGILVVQSADVVADGDGDGVNDDLDLCPDTAAAADVDPAGCSDAQVDADDDGVCDPDAASIGPSECMGSDNCPADPNPGQENLDGDAFGDACDGDIDGDTILNDDDNCPVVANTDQSNFDDDANGDACDTDDDGDGVADGEDACANTNIPESVPTQRLNRNRYALTGDRNNDSVLIFDSTNRTEFTTEDTSGCSCEQIIDGLGLGHGHTFFGCSKSDMKDWIDQL